MIDASDEFKHVLGQLLEMKARVIQLEHERRNLARDNDKLSAEVARLTSAVAAFPAHIPVPESHSQQASSNAMPDIPDFLRKAQ